MSVTDVTIKRIAAQIKEEANMYARGGDWDWKKVEGLLREVAKVATTECMIDSISAPDERPNRE